MRPAVDTARLTGRVADIDALLAHARTLLVGEALRSYGGDAAVEDADVGAGSVFAVKISPLADGSNRLVLLAEVTEGPRGDVILRVEPDGTRRTFDA